MSGRPPDEIWHESLDEGERRLHRSTPALAATGLVGGFDVMFGILALTVATGALAHEMDERTAHVLASATFGIAFVFITIGRSELFTENFLLPVGALARPQNTVRLLVRLWGVALVFNLVGLALLFTLLSVPDVLESATREAAGTLADTFAERSLLPAALSAIAAGAVMTLFTWLTAAAESDITRFWLAIVLGFVLAAPSLNHAVVSFGEIGFGIMAGTAGADWVDLAQNFAVAVVGNLVGGLGLVTLTRGVQAGGERDGDAGGELST